MKRAEQKSKNLNTCKVVEIETELSLLKNYKSRLEEVLEVTGKLTKEDLILCYHFTISKN